MITEERIKELETKYKLSVRDYGFQTIEQMKTIPITYEEQPYDGYLKVYKAEVCGETIAAASVVASKQATPGTLASEHLCFLECLDNEIRRREGASNDPS